MYKLLSITFFAQIAFGQSPDGICATLPMPVDQVMEIKRAIEDAILDGKIENNYDSSLEYLNQIKKNYI